MNTAIFRNEGIDRPTAASATVRRFTNSAGSLKIADGNCATTRPLSFIHPSAHSTAGILVNRAKMGLQIQNPFYGHQALSVTRPEACTEVLDSCWLCSYTDRVRSTRLYNMLRVDRKEMLIKVCCDRGHHQPLVIYGSQSGGVSSPCSRQVQLIFIHLDRLQNHHAFIDIRVAPSSCDLYTTARSSAARGPAFVWVLYLLLIDSVLRTGLLQSTPYTSDVSYSICK